MGTKEDWYRKCDMKKYGENHDYIFNRRTATTTDNHPTPQSAMQGYNDLLSKFDPTTDIMPQEPT